MPDTAIAYATLTPSVSMMTKLTSIRMERISLVGIARSRAMTHHGCETAQRHGDALDAEQGESGNDEGLENPAVGQATGIGRDLAHVVGLGDEADRQPGEIEGHRSHQQCSAEEFHPVLGALAEGLV